MGGFEENDGRAQAQQVALMKRNDWRENQRTSQIGSVSHHRIRFDVSGYYRSRVICGHCGIWKYSIETDWARNGILVSGQNMSLGDILSANPFEAD
jgi:hypothetical protein